MDVEKTMEFIVSQQAQFSADIQELKVAQTQTEARINKLAGLMEDFATEHDKLVKHHLRLEVRVNDLAESHKLADEQNRQTRENLNALIKVVDGLVRRDSNGNGSNAPA